jgi:alkylation response protein AidB-like acyl-CoA dehydrogenase
MRDGQPHLTPSGPEIVYVAVPVASVQVHDTWHVSGLCGTGSNDVSATDIFVPEARVFSIGPQPVRPEPLYRMPLLGWFVAHVAAVSLGIARGALEEFAGMADSKTPTFSTAVLADRPAVQLEVARAEATIAAARAFVHDAVGDLWQTVCRGDTPGPRQVALARVAAANAAEVGAAVTHAVAVLAGGNAIRQTSPLQRRVRDAEAVAHHFSVSPHVWEDAGRVFLGRRPTAPMF